MNHSSGLFVVFAYTLAAALCCRAAARYRGPPSCGSQTPKSKPGGLTSAAGFWIGLAGLFILLAIGKQLGLQAWCTSVGRAIARSGGWYEHRRIVQAVFVISVAGGGLVAFLTLAWLTRRNWSTTGLALAGAAFLISFILIRASSLHQIDVLLGRQVLGLSLNSALEIGGIACVAVAAFNAQGTRSAKKSLMAASLRSGLHDPKA
jgi:hypothetical protein